MQNPRAIVLKYSPVQRGCFLLFILSIYFFFQISSILIIATINRLCKFKKFIHVSGLISDEYFQHIVFLVTYSVFY